MCIRDSCYAVVPVYLMYPGGCQGETSSNRRFNRKTNRKFNRKFNHKFNQRLRLLSVRLFRAGIHDSALAVRLIVHIVGILYVLLVFYQLAGCADEVSLILIGYGLILIHI